MKISALILTYNEEKHIGDCIKSCPFADEIIVIDDNSTDNTALIATKMGAKVIKHSLNKNFGAQRTFAITQASGDYIFFIDADERCSDELINEVNKIKKGKCKADYCYEIKRMVYFKYNKASYGNMSPDYVIRLMPKNGAKSVGAVHETLESSYPKKRLQRGYLKHFTYDNWEQYFTKLNYYSQIGAEKLIKKGKSPKFFLDIVMRPLYGFIKMYLLKKGFLDGKFGFVLATTHSIYTFQKYVRFYYLYHFDGKF